MRRASPAGPAFSLGRSWSSRGLQPHPPQSM